MHKRFYCDSGSPVVPKREGRYNKNGRLSIVITGERNVYEFIQSFAESTDINVIIRRYANGDVDALSQVQGFYADVTDYPKTYADMMNRIKEGEEYFNSLRSEVKEAFGNDAGVFLAGLSDGSTIDKLVKYQIEATKKVNEEATKNEGETDSE